MFKIIMLFGLLLSFTPTFIFGQSKKENAEAKTDSVAYSVKGMTCGGCVAQVKGTMSEVEGVTQCEVSLENARANIHYDPTKTDKQEIEKALKSTGFTIDEIKSEIRRGEKHAEKKSKEKKERGTE